MELSLKDKVREILPLVSKPSQYLGGELNAIHKNWEETDLKVALCFPDTYEIGMSHIGLKILYHILNKQPGILAERVYAPWVDMEAEMRARGLPLFSLESHKPLNQFDIVGFTLQYELSYSNILNLLELGGVPLLASQRGANHPLVIGGGPCAFNPEPIADFFDAFVIGDAEEVILKLADTYRDWKKSRADKESLLLALSQIEGVYVPALFSVEYHPDGTIAAFCPKNPQVGEVRRALIQDLNLADYPIAPVVPYFKPIHDRLAIELARGCSAGCRFCQAGYIYRPTRERDPNKILELFTRSLEKTGYEEFSLCSLSVGDYSQITPLLTALMNQCERSKIAVSLPSLRAGTLTLEMAGQVSRGGRQTGFTMAPEAGSQRLREVINKGISEAEILRSAEDVYRSGWDLIKVYFMIGQPTETYEDVAAIADLVYKIQQTGKKVGKSGARVHVGVSSFVPKPHTPFQWEAQERMESLRAKQEFLKSRIKHRNIQLGLHDVESSYLEGVFSRGDRRLGKALLIAHELGCRFDSWGSQLNFKKWMTAFERAGIDPDFYTYRERAENEILPWDFIQTDIKKKFFLLERKKAFAVRTTRYCRVGCRCCGVCDEEITVKFHDTVPILVEGVPVENEPKDAKEKDKPVDKPMNEVRIGQNIIHPEQKNDGLVNLLPEAYDLDVNSLTTALKTQPVSPDSEPPVFRLRAEFWKKGDLRFLSHLELGRVFHRALNRAQIPIAYSQGYHVHPLISFGPALPVGYEGHRELVDFFLREPVQPDTFQELLNQHLPEDIQIRKVYVIPVRAKAIMEVVDQAVYQIQIPVELLGIEAPNSLPALLERWNQILETFKERKEVWIVREREKKTQRVNIRSSIDSLEWVVSPFDGLKAGSFHELGLSSFNELRRNPEEFLELRLVLNMGHGVIAKPTEVLQVIFGFDSEKLSKVRIIRTEMRLKESKQTLLLTPTKF
ncbi:MAG TPA: TIGR03960 family B12-binding radical SAM protein [Candidatus Limnocylindrales bacterium]|nr:TIGR03960 family B12-binding radical SAM protein [Candidatus Limnocylindrales bacterium]